MYEDLLLKISEFIELDDNDKLLVRRLFKPQKFEKGEHFLLAGDVCRYAAFIGKGIFRFYINRDGEDSTYYFACENEFISEYPSFLPARASATNIQALEPAEMLVITRDDLQTFYRETRQGERFGRLAAESIFVASIEQITSLYQDKPDARYRKFIKEYPHLEQRIPQYLIASYVGIKPQSLSRIRRRFLDSRKS